MIKENLLVVLEQRNHKQRLTSNIFCLSDSEADVFFSAVHLPEKLDRESVPQKTIAKSKSIGDGIKPEQSHIYSKKLLKCTK